MVRLIIKNIGPIKEADIDLNKVNVFIGPQSSGKSTIAKIISFCSWLEKAVTKEDIVFTNGKEAYKRLQSYHHLDNCYFSKDSCIFYGGENLAYTYNWPQNEPLPLPWNEFSPECLSDKEVFFHATEKIISPKVIYIPAERNFVSVVPNLRKYAEANDSLMSFIQSWYEAKQKYPSLHKLQILNLGIQYYLGEGTRDLLEMDNGESLTLQSASSGLQSIVPLLILIDWLSEGIYKEEKPFSFEEREKIYHILEEVDKELSQTDIANLKERLAGFVKGTIYTHTQFIIEEPEQNLFPVTQCDLLYYLLRAINHGRKHRLVITTHSPYILYALNNSMLRGLLDKELPESVTEQLACKDSWIQPEWVNVWQINNGKPESIKDEKTQTIGKHYFNDIMNDVLDDYYRMLPYLKL